MRARITKAARWLENDGRLSLSSGQALSHFRSQGKRPLCGGSAEVPRPKHPQPRPFARTVAPAQWVITLRW
jgi:hypothetical protein